MINVETCPGCGRLIFIRPVANLKVRLDSEPLEADGATRALLDGRNLWRVTETSCSGARPAELAALRERGSLEGPRIHQEHRCPVRAREGAHAPAGRPSTPPVVSSDPKGLQRPSAGRSALPGSDRPTAPSSAPSADRLRSDGPRCDDCGLIMDPGDYVAVQLGEIWIWAQHLTNCGRN